MSQHKRKKFNRLIRLFSWLRPQNKKQGVVTAMFVIGAIMLFALLPDLSLAQGNATMPADANWFIKMISEILLWIARIFMSLTVFALKFFVELAKYNGYVDAPIVIIGWTMVRDVANMFFVIVLLVIAFGTILGLEQYEWKKTLVNFVLAAVFVNFSKLIAGLIIDAAHIFTITFLNAVVATAGGNIINMFHLDSIMKFVQGDLNVGEDLNLELFGGSVMALVFSGMAMMTMGAYTLVMLFRLVILWVLVILSPFAYLLAVLPQTKSMAKEWWDEFGKHVLVAPVMVFFLWLAFAALGSGNFAGPDLNLSLEGEQGANSALGLGGTQGPTAVSISEVSSWENMANFMIAIAFLIVGLERVQKLGVRGGSATQKALDFGKNVATIASGYAAGRWLVGGTAKGLATSAKFAAMKAPLVGGEKWAKRAKNIGQDVRKWYLGKGFETTEEGDELSEQISEKYRKLSTVQGLEAEKEVLQGRRDALEAMPDEEGKEDQLAELDKEIGKRDAAIESLGGEKAIKADIEVDEAAMQKTFKSIMSPSGFMGFLARSNLALEKNLAKTERQADNRRELLWKRTGSSSGSFLDRGIARKMLGSFGDKYSNRKDQDRIERGWLEAEKMRSASKDREYETLGKLEVLSKARLKFDPNAGVFGRLQYETGAGTMQERIAGQDVRASGWDAVVNRGEQEAKLRISVGGIRMRDKRMESRLKQFREEKDEDGKITRKAGMTYDDIMKLQAEAKAAEGAQAAAEKRILEEQQQSLYSAGVDLDMKGLQLSSGRYNGEIQDALAQLSKLEGEKDKIRVEVLGSLPGDAQEALEAYNGALKAYSDRTKARREAEDALENKQKEQKYLNENKAEMNKKDRKEAEKRIAALPAEIAEQERIIAEQNRILEHGVDGGEEDKLVQEMTDASATLKDLEEKLEKGEKALSDGEGVDADKARQWQEVEQNITIQEAKVQSLREGTLRNQADRLRGGDVSVIEDVIRTIGEEIKDVNAGKGEENAGLDAAGKKAKVKLLENDRDGWKKVKAKLADGQLAYRYAAQTGIGADIAKGHKYAHNLLLSEAEQREIFDARGLETPKTTLGELIEEYGQSFGEMSVDSYVDNAGKMLVKTMKKMKAGTLTEQDRAALMGLFKRGFDRAWIDDTIYAIRDNKEANALIGEQLGWNNDRSNEEKIRDIQMLFASGGDIEHVKRNGVITSVQDVLVHDYGVKDTSKILAGIKSGNFKDSSGNNITKEVEKKMNEFMAKSGGTFGEEQKKMIDAIFEGDTPGQKALRSNLVTSWLQSTRERQSELQFLGNLRPEALKTGHIENAGWALTRDVGGGESLYVGQGVRSAKAHVIGDWRKMTVRERLQAQSHSMLHLDERNNQVALRVLRDNMAVMFAGIDPRTFNSINARLSSHLLGLSATDRASDFVVDGHFQAGRMRGKDNKLTDAAKTWIKELKNEAENLGKNASDAARAMAAAVTEQEQEAAMSMAMMSDVFSEQMHGSMQGFIMNAASGAGLNATKSAMTGDINFSIYNPEKKKRVEYTNVNDLINDYNKGDWNGGNAIAKEDRIQNFIATAGKDAGKIAQQQMGDDEAR